MSGRHTDPLPMVRLPLGAGWRLEVHDSVGYTQGAIVLICADGACAQFSLNRDDVRMDVLHKFMRSRPTPGKIAHIATCPCSLPWHAPDEEARCECPTPVHSMRPRRREWPQRARR